MTTYYVSCTKASQLQKADQGITAKGIIAITGVIFIIGFFCFLEKSYFDSLIDDAKKNDLIQYDYKNFYDCLFKKKTFLHHGKRYDDILFRSHFYPSKNYFYSAKEKKYIYYDPDLGFKKILFKNMKEYNDSITIRMDQL